MNGTTNAQSAGSGKEFVVKRGEGIVSPQYIVSNDLKDTEDGRLYRGKSKPYTFTIKVPKGKTVYFDISAVRVYKTYWLYIEGDGKRTSVNGDFGMGDWNSFSERLVGLKASGEVSLIYANQGYAGEYWINNLWFEDEER